MAAATNPSSNPNPNLNVFINPNRRIPSVSVTGVGLTELVVVPCLLFSARLSDLGRSLQLSRCDDVSLLLLLMCLSHASHGQGSHSSWLQSSQSRRDGTLGVLSGAFSSWT